jgi:hypothetical protein
MRELPLSFRFISQRQYKRKLRRDCPSYVTLQRTSKRPTSKNVADADPKSADAYKEPVDGGVEGTDTSRDRFETNFLLQLVLLGPETFGRKKIWSNFDQKLAEISNKN